MVTTLWLGTLVRPEFLLRVIVFYMVALVLGFVVDAVVVHIGSW
jgi:hypothetical protein